MYLYFHDKLPLFCKNYFTTNDNIDSYNTRSSSNIHINCNRTNYGKFSIKYQGAKVWNNLPADLKDLKESNS